MIANDQEFEIVSRQLQELKAQRDSLLRGPTQTPFQSHVELAGLEKMIARLQGEMDAYEPSPSKETVAGDNVAIRH